MQKHNLNTTSAVIYIKNMISASCVKVVKQELERTGFIEVIHIKLGEAEVQFDSQVINVEVINTILKREGFELVNDNASKLVERIKSCIIQHIFFGNNANSIIRNSDYLSESLGHPYLHLSKVFSEKTGLTLEKYIILIKIEKIKELIMYDELTLSEIAYTLGYSSIQYLSNQFKQITGFTISEYKSLNNHERKPLTAL
jgi:AraC family transcriptional regulator